MSCSVWAVNFFVFVDSSIAFTAVMKHFTSVAISTQHFIASYWDFQDAQNSLIRICNMRVYTYNCKLASFFLGNTGFISEPILRAGDGCFSLAIQNYCSVHVGCAQPNIALKAFFTLNFVMPRK